MRLLRIGCVLSMIGAAWACGSESLPRTGEVRAGPPAGVGIDAAGVTSNPYEAKVVGRDCIPFEQPIAEPPEAGTDAGLGTCSCVWDAYQSGGFSVGFACGVGLCLASRNVTGWCVANQKIIEISGCGDADAEVRPTSLPPCGEDGRPVVH